MIKGNGFSGWNKFVKLLLVRQTEFLVLPSILAKILTDKSVLVTFRTLLEKGYQKCICIEIQAVCGTEKEKNKAVVFNIDNTSEFNLMGNTESSLIDWES